MKQKEPVLLLRHSEFKKVVDYIMSVPTGTLPGSRLAETLNILDNLTIVPAQAVPMLEQALRQITQPPQPPQQPAPPVPPQVVHPDPPVDKKPNGAAAEPPAAPEP